MNKTIVWGESFPQLYSSILINIPDKICLVLNRKVCSSSIALLLSPNFAAAESTFYKITSELNSDRALMWLHENYFSDLGYVGLDSFDCVDPVSWLVDEGYLFVSTLRDPLDRLKSYYVSALDRKLNNSRFDSTVVVGTSFYNFSTVLSFGDFVERVCFDSSFSISDPHWISQLAMLRQDLVPSLVIIRREVFDTQAKCLCDKLLFSQRTIPRINSVRLSNHEDISFAISESAAEMISMEATGLQKLNLLSYLLNN